MRVATAVRAISFAFAAGMGANPALFAQQAAKQSLTLCGHQFSLWATRESALAMVADSSECVATKVQGGDADSQSYMLSERNHPNVVYGQLLFINDQVTFVSKNWDVDVHGDLDYGRVLIGLLHKFEEENHTNCTIKTSYQNTPDLDSKSATLACGSKQIRLYLTEYKGAKSIQITETLGY
jgi:hypothetical protein